MGTVVRYQAYNAHGQVVVGSIEATSTPDALAQLDARGLLVFEATPLSRGETPAEPVARHSRQPALAPHELADFMNQFGTLMGAELALDRSLRLLSAQTRSKRARVLAEGLLASVLAGAPLSSAIVEHAPSAPSYVSGLLRAGEARGQLGEAVREIALILQSRVQLGARIRTALVYPIVLAITMLAVLGLAIFTLVPSLAPLFEGSAIEPPMVIVASAALSKALAEHAVLLSILAGALGSSILLGWRTRIAVQSRQAIATALPIVGPIIAKAQTAVLARTLGSLLRNGVPIVPAVQIVAVLMTGERQQQALMQAADRLAEGETPSRALADCSLAEPALQYIAVGEEVNRLDHMLLQLASTFESQVEQDSNRALALLGPAITIVLGIVIGSIVLSVMQAILSVNELAVR